MDVLEHLQSILRVYWSILRVCVEATEHTLSECTRTAVYASNTLEYTLVYSTVLKVGRSILRAYPSVLVGS